MYLIPIFHHVLAIEFKDMSNRSWFGKLQLFSIQFICVGELALLCG